MTSWHPETATFGVRNPSFGHNLPSNLFLGSSGRIILFPAISSMALYMLQSTTLTPFQSPDSSDHSVPLRPLSSVSCWRWL
jgi:hypothetical protein